MPSPRASSGSGLNSAQVAVGVMNPPLLQIPSEAPSRFVKVQVWPESGPNSKESPSAERGISRYIFFKEAILVQAMCQRIDNSGHS